jgi:hypothetical protein
LTHDSQTVLSFENLEQGPSGSLRSFIVGLGLEEIERAKRNGPIGMCQNRWIWLNGARGLVGGKGLTGGADKQRKHGRQNMDAKTERN